MIDECGRCEDDARITETELKSLDMSKEVKKSEEKKELKEDEKKKQVEELMKSLGLVALLFFFLPTVFAQPYVMFYNCISQGNVYTCNIDPNNPVSYISIYNTDTPYNVTLSYSGTPISIYLGGNILGYGSVFTINFNIPVGTTTLTVYLPPGGGNSTYTFTFRSENVTKTNSYTVSYVVPSRQTPINQVTQENITQNVTKNVLLLPIYNQIRYMVYKGRTYNFILGVFNAGNTEISLVDISVEGLPPEVAFVEANLTRLNPGDHLYYKLILDTSNLTEGLYNFVIRAIGKHGTNLTYADTIVNLYVVGSIITNQTYPTVQKAQLNIDYVIQNNMLVIRGAYINTDKGRSYVDARIMLVGPGGITLSYYFPIRVYPGETYCIYAEAENTIPYFNCITIPTKPICYILDPKPTIYNGNMYYQVGTNVTVKEVYDCDNLNPIYRYKLTLNGELYGQPYFTIDSDGQYRITIYTEGYTPTNITIYGYRPIYIESLPGSPGNFTIRVLGSFADKAFIELYTYINGTRQKVVDGYGSIQYNFTPGTYELYVTGVFNNISQTFFIALPYVPKETVSMIDIIARNIWYIVIGLLILTIIVVIFYHVRTRTDIGRLAEEVISEMKK